MEEIGNDCSFPMKIVPGDQVYVAWSISGCYAQWCLAKPEQIFPIPGGLGFEEAAALFVNYFTAYRALLFRGGILPGERVFVHGASGGVGLAALQLCSFWGNETWGSAGSQRGLELVKGQSARAVNHRGDYQEKLARESGGFDLILEMRAEINLNADLDLLRPGGRVMIIGSRGETNISPRKTMTGEVDIRGVMILNNTEEENLATHRHIEKLRAAGKLNPVINASYPLHKAAQAQNDLMEQPAAGKRVLIM